MAEQPKVPITKKPAAKRRPATQYASAKRVEEIASSVDSVLDILKDFGETMKGLVQAKTAIPETKEEKEVKEAVSDAAPVNPAWIAKAKEIVGEALDHCEVLYPKHGGVLFTLVIKKEHSNASVDYLERYKVDRRTKEIGNEGIEGVEQWCKLVAGNLKRSK